MFSNSSIGFLLLITHILSAITVGIISGLLSRFNKNKNTNIHNFITYKKQSTSTSENTICTFSNLGEVLASSILESVKTIVMIGGFVVIFSVIISILNTSKVLEICSLILEPIGNIFGLSSIYIKGILSGLLELTNGVSLVSAISNKAISVNIIISAFLLGFGGISVALQVLSIASKAKISIKKYIYVKLLQGIIAAFYTYILLSTIPILNLNL